MNYSSKHFKVSVITVTMNCSDTIEQTMQSIAAFGKLLDIEQIVIDGVSTDSTLERLRKYNINKLKSEKDHGIYDAMNKGIAIADSDYVLFINSGDLINTEAFTSEVLKTLDSREYDIVYGDHLILKNLVPYYAHANRWLRLGMPFNHQSCFYKTSLVKLIAFNTEYRLAADFDQFLKMKNGGANIKYINVAFSTILAGGLSDSGRYKALYECIRIDGFSCARLIFLFRQILVSLVKPLLKSA